MLQEKINLPFTSPKFRASEDLYKNVKLIFQQAINQKLTLVENMSWQHCTERVVQSNANLLYFQMPE